MDPTYLKPTEIIDSHHPAVKEYAFKLTEGCSSPVESAVRLYYAVRDGIWYDPYTPFHLPEHYRASTILRKKRAYCVPKAALLCALARACGIPARIGFVTVKNHLATRELLEFLGSDLFVYHGYTELYLDGKWVKATPAFNKELCHRHKVAPLEFDGRHDSLFQPYNLEKRLFMEYVEEHGVYADIPVEIIVEAWERAYGKERVRAWMRIYDSGGDVRQRRFEHEEVYRE